MAQNHSTPPAMATGADELLQAQAELWCHSFAYLKSMALQSAVKLGIPTAIHRCGGGASLSELHAVLPVPASKRPCLSRVMRLLTASGVFREDKPGVFSLTPVSSLLVDGGHHACLSEFAVMTTSPFHFAASQRLPEWLGSEEDPAAETTPFVTAHGTGFYGLVGRDAEFGASFNKAMAADSDLVAEIVVRECGGEVFEGVASLVDVGGGDGTTAKAIAKAFPRVRCSVLELPQVVDSVPVDGMVEFVAGDMMDFIPPVDVVLLKFVLHNWSDEDCVRILKRSKDAISSREPKGKVIIIDTVIVSASKQIFEAQLLMDLCMMVLTTGEERDEEKWRKIFLDSGFNQYKISPILGARSLIELYP